MPAREARWQRRVDLGRRNQRSVGAEEQVALTAQQTKSAGEFLRNVAGVITQQRHRLAVTRGDVNLKHVRQIGTPRYEFDKSVRVDGLRVFLERLADEQVTRLRRTVEIDLRRRKSLRYAPAVLGARLPISEDHRTHAWHGDATLLSRARQERKIHRLALDDVRFRRLQLAHNPVPLSLRKGKRITRKIEVNHPVKIPVRKRMILERAEIARATHRSEDALAIRPTGEFAQNRRRAIGPLGLRIPPARFHDHRHRRLRGAAGAFVFKFFLRQSAFDLFVVSEKRLVSTLHDFFFRKSRNLAKTRPFQPLEVQRETLHVNRTAFINFPHFPLQPLR